MPISVLPSSTVKLLGSSTSISSPTDLIKELVDNSIDARATAIEVLVSHNTIDTVQVRDDGSGICVDDFGSLGRRAHTSKLRNFDDLQNGRCTTFGFRGEALASVATISTVFVTTRTAADPVASRLRLDAKLAGVSDRKPVSAPKGTTVVATNLFESLPVRKQVAAKESRKCIDRIKVLLESYALANSRVKFTYKVYGRPEPLLSYAPDSRASIQNAVSQIYGHQLTANCELVRQTFEYRDSHNLVEYKFGAFLPSPACDRGKVDSKGPFISVDSRPLTSHRGVAQKLYSSFKSHFRHSLSTEKTARPANAPFLQLSISTTTRNYDANISPLKDEVLFVNEKAVLSKFDEFCRIYYELDQEAVGPVTQDAISNRISSTPTEQDGTGRRFDGLIDHAIGDSRRKIEHIETKSCAKDLSQGSRIGGSSERQPEIIPMGHGHEENQESRSMQMRTKFAVNMCRTKSDKTDENTDTGIIEVYIPYRPAKTNSSQEKEAVAREMARKKASQQLGTIDRFFKPVHGDFEIATDATATPDTPPEDKNRPSATLNISRRPLAPLPVNVNRNERLDYSRWNAEAPSPARPTVAEDSPRGDQPADRLAIPRAGHAFGGFAAVDRSGRVSVLPNVHRAASVETSTSVSRSSSPQPGIRRSRFLQRAQDTGQEIETLTRNAATALGGPNRSQLAAAGRNQYRYPALRGPISPPPRANGMSQDLSQIAWPREQTPDDQLSVAASPVSQIGGDRPRGTQRRGSPSSPDQRAGDIPPTPPRSNSAQFERGRLTRFRLPRRVVNTPSAMFTPATQVQSVVHQEQTPRRGHRRTGTRRHGNVMSGITAAPQNWLRPPTEAAFGRLDLSGEPSGSTSHLGNSNMPGLAAPNPGRRINDEMSHEANEASVEREAGPQQYSRLSQILLMRSPSPIQESRHQKRRASLVSCNGSPRSSKQRQNSSNFSISPANDMSSGRTNEIPLPHAPKRQRLSVSHKRPMRLSSKDLPLETTPAGMETWGIAYQLATESNQVQTLVALGSDQYHLETQDYPAKPRTWCRIRTAAEAMSVELRVRQLVESWMQDKGVGPDVEHVSLAGALGLA